VFLSFELRARATTLAGSCVFIATASETPQSHEIAVTDASQMTDEELIARLRVLDEQLAPLPRTEGE